MCHNARYKPGTPEFRRAGSFLCDDYYGVLVQAAGDLDYYCKWLGCPNYGSHAKCCPPCRCTYKGQTSWLDNRKESKWQKTLVTVKNWRTHWDPSCLLFGLGGFTSLCIAMDFMHCMHLGWMQFFFASALLLLMEDCLEGTDVEKLRQIQQYIYHFQKETNSRYRFKQKLLKMTMVKPKKGFPKLRGRAADIHSLAGAIESLFAHHMDEADANHGRIKLVLSLNRELSDLLEEYGPRYGFTALPDQQAKRAYSIGLEMAQVHVHLQSLYEEEGRKLFNITTKTHFVLHSLHLSAFIHPHLVWCYKGEATMHRLQTLWKSCLPGVKHWQVAKKAALKERHLLWMRCNKA